MVRQLVGAQCGTSSAVDGGNNNKLDVMRVPITLIWAAFLIQKVRKIVSLPRENNFIFIYITPYT